MQENHVLQIQFSSTFRIRMPIMVLLPHYQSEPQHLQQIIRLCQYQTRTRLQNKTVAPCTITVMWLSFIKHLNMHQLFDWGFKRWPSLEYPLVYRIDAFLIFARLSPIRFHKEIIKVSVIVPLPNYPRYFLGVVQTVLSSLFICPYIDWKFEIFKLLSCKYKCWLSLRSCILL